MRSNRPFCGSSKRRTGQHWWRGNQLLSLSLLLRHPIFLVGTTSTNTHTMLHRRHSNNAADKVEAEQAARAARASKEMAERAEAEKLRKDQADNVGPHIEWGKGGVSAAFSDEIESACARAMHAYTCSKRHAPSPKCMLLFRSHAELQQLLALLQKTQRSAHISN